MNSPDLYKAYAKIINMSHDNTNTVKFNITFELISYSLDFSIFHDSDNDINALNVRKNGIYQIIYSDNYKTTNLGGDYFRIQFYNKRRTGPKTTLSKISATNVLNLPHSPQFSSFTFTGIFDLRKENYFNFNMVNGVLRGRENAIFNIYQIT